MFSLSAASGLAHDLREAIGGRAEGGVKVWKSQIERKLGVEIAN
jgi:hypothetical protein